MSLSESDIRTRLSGMTPEVREIYEALIAAHDIYHNARKAYEAIRSRVIAEVGYDAFRDRQAEAFRHIASGKANHAEPGPCDDTIG